MNLTPRLNASISLAAHLHRNQFRKDTRRTPYVSHLYAVAVLISSVTDDEDIIIAGLMHDSLEDVKDYSYDLLVRDCGPRVASIVLSVTEPLDANKSDDEQLPWLTRKEAYLERLRNGTVESAIVSCADKIHNTESFILSAQEEGEAFTSRFHGSTKNMIWFHNEVLSIVTSKLDQDHLLVARLTNSLSEFRRIFQENK